MSKFHINKHGVPAPCHAKDGNCPLGGDSGNENHFDSQEQAQEYLEKTNSKEHGILPGMNTQKGSYEGSGYEVSKNLADNLAGVNEDNIKEKIAKAFKTGENVSYATEDFNNNPVEFNATISKNDSGNYKVEGEISEYSLVEDDFEDYEEYEDYLEDGPDTSYNVNFEMNEEDLKKTLSESGRFNRKSASEDGAGLVTSGIYDLSRENMD